MSITLKLKYFVLLNNGKVEGLTLTVKPTDRFFDMRMFIFNEHKKYFRDNGLDDLHLELYTPKNPLPMDQEDIFSRAKAETVNQDPVSDTTLIQSVFGVKAGDESTIHLVVAPAGLKNAELGDAPPGWKVQETDLKWQLLYNYWKNKDIKETMELKIIPLALDERGRAEVQYRLPFLVDSSRSILVVEQYRNLCSRVLELQQKRPDSGVVVTGQPGTGKTTWLYFLLICLIIKGDTVVFYTGGRMRLFYHGRVYSEVEGSKPEFPSSSGPVWCLIDIDNNTIEPPAYLTETKLDVFHIQACSPNPARYHAWIKQCGGFIWGIQLWRREEILDGFKLNRSYVSLLSDLQSAFEDLPDRAVLDKDYALNYAWEIAQEPPASLSGDSLTRAEGVLEEMVYRIVQSYGEAPRDVYKAIFDHSAHEKDIQNALNESKVDDITEALRHIAGSYLTSYDLSASHRLIAMTANPAKIINDNDTFMPKAKSQLIGNRMIEKLGHLQHLQSLRLFDVYRAVPQSSLLAGWIFEGLVHGLLCGLNTPLNLSGTLIPMYQTGESFSFCTPSASPHLEATLPFPLRLRSYTTVRFLRGHVRWPPRKPFEQSLEDCFCVPQVTNNALFDSFCLEFEVEAHSVTPVVWIFQATVAEDHRGSERGYQRIRSISNEALLRASQLAQLDKKDVKDVQLRYVLVCPTPEGQRSWTMPAGWTGRVNGVPVQGKVFCQFIDASGLIELEDD